MIWILCQSWGVSVGLCLFYRPLLNLPTKLLNSTAFILHTLSSVYLPDPRILSYWLCQHLLTFLAFLPPPALILSHLTIQSWKPLSLRSHSPSPHSILTFVLIWCHPLCNWQLYTPSKSHRSSLPAASPGLPHCPSLRPSALCFSLEEFPPPLLPEHMPLSKLCNLATIQQIVIKYPKYLGLIYKLQANDLVF